MGRGRQIYFDRNATQFTSGALRMPRAPQRVKQTKEVCSSRHLPTDAKHLRTIRSLDGRAEPVAEKLEFAAFDPKERHRGLTTTNRARFRRPQWYYVAVDFHGEIMIVPTDADFGGEVAGDESPVARSRAEWFAPGRRSRTGRIETGERKSGCSNR